MSFELRPYQNEAVLNTLTAWHDGHKKVAVIAPTGCGKTEIFCEIAKRHLNDQSSNRTLILSHLDILTQQTTNRIRDRIGIQPGVSQAHILPKDTDRLIVSTMQSSRQYWRSAPWMNRITCLIIDEAHYLMCNSYDKIISYFPEALLLGCTATPFKMNKLMLNYFDEVAYSISLKELIDAKYLVPPILHEIEYQDGSLAEKMGLVSKLYKDHHIGQKAVVYMDSIENALLMRNVLMDNGINARAVTSKVTGHPRDRILVDFKDNDQGTQVLVTVNVLTMGFDSPNVQVIFCPFKSNSPTIWLQRIGRGLRLCESIGKTHCDVYAFGDHPTIKRGFYRKLSELVLDRGKRGSETYEGQLVNEYMPTHSEQYVWTEKVVKLIRTMRNYSFDNIAKMLNEKAFPKRFIGDLSLLRSKIIEYSAMPHGDKKPTEKQVSLLISKGVDKSTLDIINKKEASVLIGILLNNVDDSRWKIKSGRYAGRHISCVPFPYVKYMLDHRPDTNFTKLWRDWHDRNQKRKN